MIVVHDRQPAAILPLHGKGEARWIWRCPSHAHDGDAFGPALGSALGLLAGLVRALRTLEGPVPWNAWLHAGEHWHLEVVPRLSTFAGTELGAGMFVLTLAPEDAAAALRRAVQPR